MTVKAAAPSSRAFLAIAVLATLPLLATPFVAVAEASNYHYAFLSLVPVLWLVFAIRRWLRLHPFHFVLYALSLLLHDLGALGCYTKEYVGLAFDTYVHFYFGLVGALILERAFRGGLRLSGWRLWGATILLLLGLGAIHELVEFASTMVLGPEAGMYKIGNADVLDTQKDLFNNLLGGLIAMCLAGSYRSIAARRPSAARETAPSVSP